MKEFYSKIEQAKKLKQIKSVSWMMDGEDKFKPYGTRVVLEDVEGNTWEMVLHVPDCDLNRSFRSVEEVLLNVVLTYHHIMPQGKWLGITDDIPPVVNELRNLYPYEGNFVVREGSMFYEPKHRF